jgi:hypothetical protein
MQVCTPVSGLVKAGQSFHGAYCPAVTYKTINGTILTTTTCRCTACIGVWFPIHPQCIPIYLIKSPAAARSRH